MKIRKFTKLDSVPLAKLFYGTIHTVNRSDYAPNQLKAWAPEERDMSDWEKSFENKWVFVACDEFVIAGFGELEPDGHIDRFYISKDFIALGVGRKIYDELEDAALNLGLDKLFVEASITARPFFEKMGFVLLKEQVVSLRGVNFINYAMEKDISGRK